MLHSFAFTPPATALDRHIKPHTSWHGMGIVGFYISVCIHCLFTRICALHVQSTSNLHHPHFISKYNLETYNSGYMLLRLHSANTDLRRFQTTENYLAELAIGSEKNPSTHNRIIHAWSCHK
jgi:hypothetical protein